MKDDKIEYIVPWTFIRSKTNAGDFAKQYFTVIKSNSHEISLVVKKLVLSSNFELYNDYDTLKFYKGKSLLKTMYSIKLSTLSTIVRVLRKYDVNL